MAVSTFTAGCSLKLLLLVECLARHLLDDGRVADNEAESRPSEDRDRGQRSFQVQR